MARDVVNVDFEVNSQGARRGLNDIGGIASKLAAGPLLAIGATAAISMKKIVDFSKEAVDAFKVQEQAQIALIAAIQSTGREADISADELYDFASSLQDVTTFGDEATIQAMALLQSLANLDQNGLMSVTPAIQDMAQALGMDLRSAASLVGKTLGSSTNALSRYGIEIDMTGTEAEKLAQVMEQLNDKFGGAAELAADSATGAIVQYQNAMGDLKEAIGGVVANALQPFVKTSTQAIKNLTDMIKGIETFQEVIAFDASIENIIPGYNDLDDAAAKIEAIEQQISILNGTRFSGNDDFGSFFNNTDTMSLEDYTAMIEQSGGTARQAAIQYELMQSSISESAENLKVLEAELSRLNGTMSTNSDEVDNYYNEMLKLAVENSPISQMRKRAEELEFQIKQLESLQWKPNQQFQIEATNTALQIMRGELSAVNSEIVDIISGTGQDNPITLIDDGEGEKIAKATVEVRKMKPAVDALTESQIELKEAMENMADVAMASGIQALGMMADSMVMLAVEGEKGWAAYANAGLQAIASVLRAIGAELAIKAVASLATPWMAAAYAGGSIAAYAAAGAIGGAGNRMSTPSSGGIGGDLKTYMRPSASDLGGPSQGPGTTITNVYNIQGSVVSENEVRSLGAEGYMAATGAY